MIAVAIFAAQVSYSARREVEKTIIDYSHRLYDLWLKDSMAARSLFGDEFYKSYGEAIAWLISGAWRNIVNEAEYISKIKIRQEMEIERERGAKGVQLTRKQLEFHNTFHAIGLEINEAIYRLLLTKKLAKIIDKGRLLCILLAFGAILALFTTIIAGTSTINGIPDGYNLLVAGILILVFVLAFGWLVYFSFIVLGLNIRFQGIPDK